MSTPLTSQRVEPNTARMFVCQGQKYAVIARPPVMGGKVVSYDPTEAKKIPGVVQIVDPAAPSPRFLAFRRKSRLSPTTHGRPYRDVLR